jgi:hypothetical protein
MNKIKKSVFLIFCFLIFIVIVVLVGNKISYHEKYKNNINKTIWILWFQGWENAPLLQKIVAKSWENKNPYWKINYLDNNNLHHYVDSEDMKIINDKNKTISYQSQSDIIRISLLKKHGGVWIDSTFLCLQSLDDWVYNAIEPSNFWMYHGTGAGMDIQYGPASWFIVSIDNSYIITKWNEAVRDYWNTHHSTDNYFWLDELFKQLFETDKQFQIEWNNVPYISCEKDGSSHTLSKYGTFGNHDFIKKLFSENPPYGLKFWNKDNNILQNCDEDCKNSNGVHAIQLSLM